MFSDFCKRNNSQTEIYNEKRETRKIKENCYKNKDMLIIDCFEPKSCISIFLTYCYSLRKISFLCNILINVKKLLLLL